MSNVIGIMGESGSGKTTGLRNLDPKSTYIIDCDGKGLSWGGWRKQYNAESKNYSRTNKADLVLKIMQSVNDNAEHIKVLVVDTLNAIMVHEEYIHKDEKGFDKWADLAWNVWGIVDYALTMRDDLTVVFVCHIQTDRDDYGYQMSRIKTNGRKLNKLELETRFQNLFHAYRDTEGEYVFGIRANNDTAKCSYGFYEGKDTVPNDLALIIDDLREFEGMEPIKKAGGRK